MTNYKTKPCLRKCISGFIYLSGLAAQIYSLFIYHDSYKCLVHKPLKITLYIFFVVYLLFGIVLIFRIFKNKSKPILIILTLFAVFLLSFPFTNKYQPKEKVELYDYNQYNYLLRDDTNGIRGHRDAEIFLYYYLEEKNVYASLEDNYIYSIAYNANKYITYDACNYNVITDTDYDLILSDEQALRIASDKNYYYFMCEFLYRSLETPMEVFAYVGEDYNDSEDIMVCSDSEGSVYFIPRHKWEELV